jgi:hypothetical protein
MAPLLAVRSHLGWLRRQHQLLLWLVLLTGLITLLVFRRADPGLLATLSGRNLTTMLQTLLVLVLLLIPISGVYSVISQFAFWNGWLGGLTPPAELFGDAADGSGFPSYLIYLDGIHQSERDHPPRVTAFLEALEQRLPDHVRLIKGLETYTLTPARLADDTGSQWFWRRLFSLQEHHPNTLVSLVCAFLVQANNVIKVGISSDRRYGPILNYELALKVAKKLAEQGFIPPSGASADPVELVLLGYSGGGEMAMGMADYLRRLCRCPVRIITCCGVFSGNQLLEQVGAITMVVGTQDPVAAVGRIAYPGRSPLLPLSNWNRAVARGQVQRLSVSGLKHNGSHGPFADVYREAVINAIVTQLSCDWPVSTT